MAGFGTIKASVDLIKFLFGLFNSRVAGFMSTQSMAVSFRRKVDAVTFVHLIIAIGLRKA